MLDAKLVVVGGDAKSGEVRLKLPTVIGRGKEAGLTVPHALVSRRHSEIFEREGRLYVRDLGSLNGTFVNNTKIEGEQVLEPNQLLTLGNITFRAVYQAADVPPENTETVSLNLSQAKTEEALPQAPLGLTATPTFDETIPVDSIPGRNASELPAESPATASRPKPARSMEAESGEEMPTAPPPIAGTDSAAIKPQAGPGVPGRDSDSQLSIDLDSEIFSLETDAGPDRSISTSAIDRLVPDQEPGSFVEDVDLGDQVVKPASVNDMVKIDLGEEGKSEPDVDESRLGSFLRKLEK